nr:uncharacterized mitochondrial protein AtMg00810-like [Tanacetum cinerariifolium]
MNQFCEMKGILRHFIVVRTPQQKRVVERRNRTLIEAARTMLVDSKLLTTFWAEAVNTACYVQNRVLVVKPHNKTPYKLFYGKTPTLSFMRPFGYPVTILNTIDHLGKFDGKADEGFFVGNSLNIKSFRVFIIRTMIVEENLHIRFSETTPNVVGSRPDWLFDTDALTRTMNYEPIVAGTQFNGFVGTKASDNACQARKKTELVKDYIFLPLWTADLPFSQDPKSSHDDGSKPSSDDGKKVDENPRKENECKDQEKENNVNSTNNVNTVGNVNAVSSTVNVAEVKTASTPMETQNPLLKDKDGEEVDVHMYRSMIGSLMYLTSLRPDIMFAVCACARYQVNQKVSHLHAIKRIFRYLKGQPKLSLWYLKDSAFDLVAYTNSDYAGASLDRKFITEAEYVAASSSCRQVLWIQNQLLDYGKPTRKDTQVPQPSGPTESVVDEVVHKELGDSLVRAATTVGQWVLDLEKTKTAQSNEIDSLKIRVNKLEKRNKSRIHKLKTLYKVCLSARVESSDNEESLGEDASKQERRIDAIDADEDITLVNDADK